MSKLSVNNTYFTPVKNKSTRRLHKRTRGQGKP